MNKIIEEIRSVDIDISEMEAKKADLRKKLEQHRSLITPEELEEIKVQKETLERSIKEKKELRDRLSAISAEFEEKGETRIMNDKLLHFKDGMERADVLSSAEYRSAFFKTLQRRSLSDIETAAYRSVITAEQRAMTSAAGSAGAAIPTYTMNMIIGQLRETPNALGLITLEYMPGLTSFPVENVVNEASWVAEGTDSTPSDDKLKAISLAAYTLIKTIKITAQLQEMAIDAFEAWIVDALIRKLRAACDKAVISGTGSNQPTGLSSNTWNASNSIEVAASASLTYDNLVELEALLGEDFAPNAVWVMNSKMKAQVMKLKDDQKRPLFDRALENGFVGTLLGYPVRLDKNVADNEAYFGDWKAAYVMNFAKAIEINASQEAGFMSGSTIYRGLALVDGKPTGVAGAMVKLKKAAGG